MRVFPTLALVLLAAVVAHADPTVVCGTPGALPELKLPAYTVTEKTAACDRRIEAAFARAGKTLEAFTLAQRRVLQGVSDIQELQDGVACGETLKAFTTLRARQYAAIVKVLSARLRDDVGRCAIVLKFAATPAEPAPDETPVPEPVNPGMIEPI
jgi:hypothetical protein